MSNNSILLIDPNFEPANSANMSLLVKIGADTLSYAIIDHESKFVHAVYDEQECEDGYVKFRERLKTDVYLKLRYKNVKVAAHTPNIVFIPEELFSESETYLYTKFFTDANTQVVYVQPSSRQNFYSIFSLPFSAEKVIKETWPESSRLLQNAGLLELASKIDTDCIIADFTVGVFQFVYIKNGKMAFMQSYQIEDMEELTYYILLIVNQLEIDVKQVSVNACGIIHKGDSKWNVLAQYFSNIELLKITTDLDTEILDDMPAHYYTSLLSLLQCG